MKKHFENFVNGVNKSIKVIGQIVRTGNNFDNTIISEEAFGVINNPNDKKKLDEAVYYLQKHSSEKTREVNLSGNNTITISLG